MSFTNRNSGRGSHGNTAPPSQHDFNSMFQQANTVVEDAKKLIDPLMKKISEGTGKRARNIVLNGMDAKLIELDNGNLKIEFTSVPVDTVRNELYNNGFTIEGI